MAAAPMHVLMWRGQAELACERAGPRCRWPDGKRTDEEVVLAHDPHDDVVLGELAAQRQFDRPLHGNEPPEEFRPRQVRERRVR